jgi:hypothetical protein
MASPDFSNEQPTLSDPADDVFAVTPNDDADLERPTRAIRCAGAGNVSFINRYNRTCTAAFLAGEERALRAVRIRSTGTTATGIEGIA